MKPDGFKKCIDFSEIIALVYGRLLLLATAATAFDSHFSSGVILNNRRRRFFRTAFFSSHWIALLRMEARKMPGIIHLECLI